MIAAKPTLAVFAQRLARLAASAVCLLAHASAARAEDGPIDFRAQIAPLLRERCIRCHHAGDTKGGLDLTSHAGVLAGAESGPVILPGRADESLLLAAVAPSAGGEKPSMPAEGEPLTPAEIDILRRWITNGASWPDDLVLTSRPKADRSWWSLQPLRPTPPPDVPGMPAAWSHHPIDRFVYQKLAAAGLSPAPRADRGTLIRRASYDLTGLPPTPEEVAAFVNDDSPQAYEQLIDRLLSSPRYGEQWGRHWLDVVRFGESSGFERNIIRDDAWPFRDYVIRSFNDDKPFDRLIVEHLAGDQLAAEDPAVEVGTGFLVAGPYDDVGNKDPVAAAQIRANTLDDIVTATGSAILGLTINCARCHDHKFDPIPQADYYRIQAAMSGVDQGSRPLATAQQRQAHREQRQPLEQELREVAAKLATVNQYANQQVAERRAALVATFDRPRLDPAGAEETFPPQPVRFVRMKLTSSRSAPRIVLDEFEIWTAEGAPRNVALASHGARVTALGTRVDPRSEESYSPRHLIDGRFDKPWVADRPSSEFTIELPRLETVSRVFWSTDRLRAFAHPYTDVYTIEVSRDGQQWTRVADNGRRMPVPARLEAALGDAALGPDERRQRDELEARQAALEARLRSIPPLPTAWIGRFSAPAAPAYRLIGGDPQKRGETIAPASLEVLADVTRPYALAVDAPEGRRRLELARWMVAAENPLTPRVLANRLWHYHFGTGLVDTPSDFGYMGGKPSHAELLDWLAGQLQTSGWRLKPLHRAIMLSETYRQSSHHDRAAAAVDFDSRLLWRFPPRRLSAEELRDTILSLAGKLDLRMGGPGYRLYEYQVDNVATYVPRDQFGPETFRRAVYHQNARAAAVDLLSEFDCPDPAVAAPRRASTTSPLQALTLLNHRFTVEQAEFMAARLARETHNGDASAQVRRAFELAYSRWPEPEELATGEALFRDHGAVAFCRALLNTSELLYVR